MPELDPSISDERSEKYPRNVRSYHLVTTFQEPAEIFTLEAFYVNNIYPRPVIPGRSTSSLSRMPMEVRLQKTSNDKIDRHIFLIMPDGSCIYHESQPFDLLGGFTDNPTYDTSIEPLHPLREVLLTDERRMPLEERIILSRLFKQTQETGLLQSPSHSDFTE